jgi:mannose-6-phosphate isomerase class I
MMNFMVLEKGESIYVPADGIHAYLLETLWNVWLDLIM